MENAQPLENESQSQPLPPKPEPAPPMRKHAGLAGFLALFPGMGHIYNGLYVRGVVFFVIIASLMGMIENDEAPVLGFAIAFCWIFNVIDSVRQAKLINYGYAQDLGLEDMPKVPKAGQGGLLAGILMIGLGIVAVLRIYFHMDLSWMVDLWPFGLMAIGGWLIWAYIRDNVKSRDDNSGSILPGSEV